MASSLEKILASAGKANTNKQAQVVVNSGAGRVDLPVETDASKLTGQDVQQIVKTSPVKQVITPEQTAQAKKQNGDTVYLPTGTAVPLSQRAKTVNLPQGNTGVKGEEWQRQMLDGMMRGGQKSGGSAAQEESNWDAFKRGFGYGSERLAASLLGFGENVTDFLGSGAYKGAQALASLGGLTPNAVSDYFGKVADSYYDDSITDRYEESIRQRYNPTQRDEMVTGVGQSIAQILAASALGQAGGAASKAVSDATKIADAAQKARTAEAISKAAFGISAAGGSAREAIKEGASTEQALAYGAAAGSMETLIESIAGGIPGLGKGKLSEVVRKIVSNPIVSKTVDIAGEGAEEAASAFLTPFIKRAIYNKDAEFASADEIAQNAILGMITSGVLQAGVELPQAIGNRKVNLPMAKSAQKVPSTEPNLQTTEDAKQTASLFGAETDAESDPVSETDQIEAHRAQLRDQQTKNVIQDKAWYDALQQVKDVGARLGVTVQTTRDLPNGVGGEYRNGVISISENAKNPVRSVFAHELTHHLEATETYAQLQDYVLKRVENATKERGSDYSQYRQDLIDAYWAKGKTIDDAGVDKELVAYYIEENLFTNPEEIARLANTHRNLVQVIRDWFEDLRVKFRGKAEEKELLRAQRLFEKALRETNVEGYRTSGDGQYAFAGEKAETADLEALERAKQMQTAGVDANTILRDTGWFVGRDGKWRFEIDDSSMQYYRGGDAAFRRDHPEYAEYQSLMAKMLDGSISADEYARMMELHGTWGGEYKRLSDRVAQGNAKLQNILDHPALYEAYPDLKNAEVVFDVLDGERGRFDGRSNRITISETLKNAPDETLLHEIQHAIQRTENFSRGASPEYWADFIRSEATDKNGRTPSDLYRNTSGEIEARDTARRMKMTADERRAQMPDLGDENTVFADGAGNAYSIARTRNMPWKTQVSEYFKPNGIIKSSDSLYLGESDVIGVSNAPLYIPTSVVNKAVRPPKGSRSAHSLKETDIASLADGIKNAPVVIHNPSRNAIVFITENKDTAKNQVIVTFDLNNDLYGETAHKATSIHGREDIASLLKSLGEDATIFVKNEKKLNQMLPGNQILKSLELLAKVELNNNTLPQTEPSVKMSGQNSIDFAGKELLIRDPNRRRTVYRELDAQRAENAPKTTNAANAETAKGMIDISDPNRDFTVSNGSVGHYLTSAISEESKALGKSLGVPYSRRNDFAKERLIEIANNYMRTGEFDADAAISIFDEGWEQGQLINQDYYNNYQDLRRELQATNLQITEDVKRNIPDFAEWRKRNRYKVGMTENGGIPIDTKYQELSAAHPELFPESITDLSDQLQKIADVSGELYAVPKTLSEIYGDQTGENYRNMRKAFSERMLAFEEKLKQARTVQAETDAKNVKEATPGSLDAAKKAYAEAKKARKAYEKLSRKSTTLLSDPQKRQVQALAMGKLTEAEIPESAAKQTILALANLKRQELEALAPVKEYKIQYRNGLRNTAASLLEGSYAWKDKASGLQYSRETMERNIRDMAKDKKQADAIIAEYFTPVHKQEAERTRFRNQMRDRIRALKLTKDESTAVQYLGEKRAQIAEWEERGFKNRRDKRDFEGLKSEVEEWKRNHPNIDYEKVDNAIDVFRETYNELFEQMNEVRVRNGYEPVDYRKNYFPHFQENRPDTLIAKLGGALGIEMNVKELPVDIAGRTHTFRPGIQWFGNIQRRTTDKTVYDAVRGFDQYIEGISNVIYHTDNIQKLRALSNEIRYEGTEVAIQEQIDRIRDDPNMSDYEKNARIKDIYDEQPTKLSKFVQELEEYTNILAGKKSRRDRNMEGNIGRKLYSMAKTLNNRVAANMVALNPGSWVTNFAPAIQTATQTNPITMARAIKDTVRSYVQDDGFANESTFLTNRRGSNPLVVDAFEKVSNFLSSPMEWIDHFTSDTVVRARYYDNMNRGMDHQSALDEADSYAAGLIGDRSKGAMPTLFEAKNPLTKTFTAFQLEVNNQLSWMFKDLPRDERNKGAAMVTWKLMSLFIGSYLANDLYEKLRGSRVLFDPLSWVNDAVGDITGYQMPNVVDIAKNAFAGENKLPFRELAQTETTKLPQAFSTLGTNAVSELPFVGGLLGGGRLPISSAIPDASQLVRLTDSEIAWDRKKKILQDELLKKPAAYLLLPTGGGQIKKTVEGLATVNAGGSYTLDNEGRRKLQYPVFKNGDASDAMTWGQAALFGKSSLPMAKEWVDSGFKTKSVKFTEAYDYLSQEGVNTKEAYNLLERLNEIQKTDDASATVLKREALFADQTLTPEQKTKVDQILFEPKNPVDYSSAAAQRTSLATDSQKEKIAKFEKIGGTAEKYWTVYDAFKKAEGDGDLSTEQKKKNVYNALPYKYQKKVSETPKEENLNALKSYLLQSMSGLSDAEKQYLDAALIGKDVLMMDRNVSYGSDSEYALSAIGATWANKYDEIAEPAGIDMNTYVSAYYAYASAEWEEGKSGAKSKAIKAAIDSVAGNLPKAKRQVLYEAFNVGKSYW